MKLIIIFIIVFNSYSLFAKPDECKFPKPKIKRLSYENFIFDKDYWEQQSFLDSEYKLVQIKNQYVAITHEVPIISALMFKNTKWNESKVINQLDNAAQVLNQCGVRINQAHLIKSVAPNKSAIIRRHRSCFDPEPDGQHHITNTVPYLPGIRIFFIEKFIVGPEAFASPEYKSKNTPAQNTIWIRPKGIRPVKPFNPNYQVLAHEIGHILLDSGHIWDDEFNTPNLMSGKASLLNNELTDEQCDLIKKHRLVKKIIH